MPLKKVFFGLVTLALQIIVLLALFWLMGFVTLPLFLRSQPHHYAALTLIVLVLSCTIYAIIYYKFIKDIIYKENKNDPSQSS